MSLRRLAKLPIVDLSLGTERGVANEIRKAASEHGFFYLTGHGIKKDIMRNTFKTLQTYFELPNEEKMKAHHTNTGKFRGYIGYFEQGNYGVDETDVRASDDSSDTASSPMDFKEVFHIGTELPPNDKLYNELLYGENVWPPGQDPFRKDVQQYYDEVENLSNRMFELFALSLGLPREYFLSKSISSPMNSMNCVHYPPLSEFPNRDELSEDQLGIGAHTDFEAFTLLSQNGPTDPCLDIFRDEEWMQVPPIPDAFVVNIGDMLARWSGDIFQSTVHRARNHERQDRYSIAFFRCCDYDCMLSPADVKKTISDSETRALIRDYPQVLAGDHMMSRISRANETILPQSEAM
uniref:Fe2OG dioxygenase domain-containing protein n=1 Tax=Mucochytrium quahogii TaxID=96639 RepID=A0A7S2WQP7_9STRA|mmetsp:Transcript_31276/g.50192  ORF Transcript_31276/g.50192 Transcript_31276/m.50192 type:complete len:350 (-) Transcript_31276:47-1096(-)